MKKAINLIASITVTLLLAYNILFLFVYGGWSLLSLGKQTNFSVLYGVILIPFAISIVSMVFCIVDIWRQQHKVHINSISFNTKSQKRKTIRILVRTIVKALLSYAILTLFIYGVYSLLTCGPINFSVTIENYIIPFAISIISMVYCIYRLWHHAVDK